MFSLNLQAQNQQLPISFEHTDPLNYDSRNNTNRSLPYEHDTTSVNSFPFSSTRSHNPKTDLLSVRSRISTKNMIDFEEFVLDNATDWAQKLKSLELPRPQRSEMTDNKEISGEISNRIKLFAEQSNASIYNDIQTLYRPKLLADHPFSVKPESQNGIKGVDISHIKMAYVKSDVDTISSVREILMNEPANLSIGGDQKFSLCNNEEFSHLNFVSSEEYEKKKDTLGDEENKKENILSQKPVFLNDFQDLKDEVFSIQKELKTSEAYNKKLEEHIYTQSLQITTILQSFSALKNENDSLKQNLTTLIPQSTTEAKEPEIVTGINKENYQVIDHAIAKKTAKFYMTELEYFKSNQMKLSKRNEDLNLHLLKEIQDRDKIIQDLLGQIRDENRHPDSSFLNTNLFTKQGYTRSQSTPEQFPQKMQVPKTYDFQTLNPVQTSEETFFHTYGDQSDIKFYAHPEKLTDNYSHTDTDNHKHMTHVTRKFQQIQEKSVQGIPKETYKNMERTDADLGYPFEVKSLNSWLNSNLISESTKLESKSACVPSSENKSSYSGLDRVGPSFDGVDVDKDIQRPSYKKNIEDFNPMSISLYKSRQPSLSKEDKSQYSKINSHEESHLYEAYFPPNNAQEIQIIKSTPTKLAFEVGNTDYERLDRKSSKSEIYDKEQLYSEKRHSFPQNERKRESISIKDFLEKKSQPNKNVYPNNSKPMKERDEYSGLLQQMETSASLKSNQLNTKTSANSISRKSKRPKTPNAYQMRYQQDNTQPLEVNEKRSKSVSSSRDRIFYRKKDRTSIGSDNNEHLISLQTQVNETISSVNSVLEKMLDKRLRVKTHSTERERKFTQTQSYENELFPEIDSTSTFTTSINNPKINATTSSLQSTYSRSKPNLIPEYTYQRTPIHDGKNKENYIDQNLKSIRSTAEGAKQSFYYNEVSLEEFNVQNSDLERLTPSPIQSTADVKAAVYKKPLNTRSNQARHQTPTTKVYLDLYQSRNAKDLSLSSKKSESSFNIENESNTNSRDRIRHKSNIRNDIPSSRTSSNKKPAIKNAQSNIKRPVYNNLLGSETVSINQTAKNSKINSYQSSLDQQSYDLVYQNDKELLQRRSQENSRKEFSNTSSAMKQQSDQDMSKARRKSFQNNNLYNCISKKLS